MIIKFLLLNTYTCHGILFIIVLCLISAQQEQCRGPIGSNNAETVSTPSSTQLFYLNTANPAPCTGSVMSWRVCYYGPDASAINSISLVNYWATYAVYRGMGSGI